MQFQRTIEPIAEETARTFRAMIVCGPRQVGKTWLLKKLIGRLGGYQFLSLDDEGLCEQAKNDPKLFLQIHPAPLCIDEIQRAPELFPEMKMLLDNSSARGQYLMTGSQQFKMMKRAKESLAGRVGILRLQGFSKAEIEGKPSKPPFVPSLDAKHWQGSDSGWDIRRTYDAVVKGGYPECFSEPQMNVSRYFQSYIETYVERDIREMVDVTNIGLFRTFMRVCAARTGQLLNYADLARDTGISTPTARMWLSLLEISGLIYILYPYYNNLIKRAVKTPKLYFTDTGLCSHLLGITTAEAAISSPMSGALLETYVIMEICKSHWYTGTSAEFWFYRDASQHEVDLVAEAAAVPAPVAHWAFNDMENPGKDTSGNGYDLESAGGTLSLTSDADDYGSAARFTKDGAYLKWGGERLPANFPSGGASFTVNVRMSGTGGGQNLDLFSMGDVTTAGKSFRICNGNYPRRLGYSWQKASGDGGYEQPTSDGILANSYVTSTFVYEADTQTLTCYQDGVQVSRETNVTPDIDANGTVYLAYTHGLTAHFECKLDDVQVFAEALSAAQVRRVVQALETGTVPGVMAASSVSVDDGALFYTPVSASVAGLSGAGAVAVGAHGTLAAASASGFTGTVFGPGALALAENAVLTCTSETPAIDMTGTLTLPTTATVCFAETEEALLADTRHSYVVARATSLAGATDLSGWTCRLNGIATDKVTFKIKGNTVLAKVRRGLLFLIK